METVHEWADIEANYEDGLILGNGASIAFDSRFNYGSLKEKAQTLGFITADVQRVFDHLDTGDFELVLRMLWHASKINLALEIPDNKTIQAYDSVRDALIEVVREIHVTYSEVSGKLPIAAMFMARFSTVIYLNYDVLVYWARQVGNDGSPHRFKDCFDSGEFRQDWEYFRKPYGANDKATLVFYPHGSLALAVDLASGTEFKISAGGNGSLLETVFEKWRAGGTTSLFVSEGTSEQKRRAIRRSPYLSTVYGQVLPNLGESVVLFGWSIGENDVHLLDAICRGRPSRFAVAVDPAAANIDVVESIVRYDLGERLGPSSFELKFFDRGSGGCWIST